MHVTIGQRVHTLSSGGRTGTGVFNEVKQITIRQVPNKRTLENFLFCHYSNMYYKDVE